MAFTESIKNHSKEDVDTKTVRAFAVQLMRMADIIDASSFVVAPIEYIKDTLLYNEAKLYCFSLNIDGKVGWRLPTVAECEVMLVGVSTTTEICIRDTDWVYTSSKPCETEPTHKSTNYNNNAHGPIVTYSIRDNIYDFEDYDDLRGVIPVRTADAIS
jgi:hypothetical protein